MSVLSFDYDLVNDFRKVFSDNCHAIQLDLLELEHKSSSKRALKKLTDHLDSIRTDLHTLRMHDLAELVQSLLQLISRLQSTNIRFDPRLSDLTLLVSHRVREWLEVIFSKNSIDQERVQRIIEGVRLLGPADRFVEDCNTLLNMLDPRFQQSDPPSKSFLQDDIAFFRLQSKFVEDRIAFKSGAAERVFRMATNLNQMAGLPVDPDQLQVAVYTRDVGMAYIPLDWNTTEQFSSRERLLLEQHPALSARFLSHLPGWDQAMTIVLQHHERYDGKGYPEGLSGDKIHPGALMLAIADTFEAMSHERAHRRYKRPLLRIVAEINSNRGSQFAPLWVDHFNTCIRKYYQ